MSEKGNNGRSFIKLQVLFKVNERGLVNQSIGRRHVWTCGVTHLAKLDFLRMRGKDNVKLRFISI
jgi:hypothetical protein